MQLIFHGQSYVNQKIGCEAPVSQLVATFRGQRYQIKQALVADRPAGEMIYRGVRYRL
ncbi:MAG: DUF4278 domain-containing protein [Leptolyngbyaceae cyanobacterium]